MDLVLISHVGSPDDAVPHQRCHYEQEFAADIGTTNRVTVFREVPRDANQRMVMHGVIGESLVEQRPQFTRDERIVGFRINWRCPMHGWSGARGKVASLDADLHDTSRKI